MRVSRISKDHSLAPASLALPSEVLGASLERPASAGVELDPHAAQASVRIVGGTRARMDL
jgi:hypothetical protein